MFSKNGFISEKTKSMTLAEVMASPASPQRSIIVTDYGGTIAVSDGVRWRLERLYTTWAGKPAVHIVPVGTELSVTDLNKSVFYSDGGYWRPVGGRAQIAMQTGTVSVPLATLSAAGKFSLAGGDILIPAGLIAPNSKLCAMTQTRKIGTAAVASVNSRLGVGSGGQGINTDAYINGGQHANQNLGDMKANGFQLYGASKTKAITGGWQTENSSSYSSVVELTTNINTDADMYVSAWVTAVTSPDTVALLSLHVWLEG